MKLDTVDYRAPDAAEQFVKSLRETGFGVLSERYSAHSYLMERLRELGVI